MTSYNATIEVDLKGDVDVDQVMGELEAYHPSLSTSPRGWWAATITLPAESLLQATQTAVAVVERAYGAPSLTAAVMPTSEFDARQGWAPVPELVSVRQAAELLGVSRQRVLQRIDEKTLPAEKVGREYVIPRSAVVQE